MDTGGQIRTGQILRHLNNRHFDITLLCPATPEQEKIHCKEIKEVCNTFISYRSFQSQEMLWKFRRTVFLFKSIPLSVATDFSSALQQKILKEQKKSQDVIVYDFIHSAVNYVDPESVKTVVFTHNVEQEIYYRHAKVNGKPWIRAIWHSQYKKMKRFEDVSLKFFDRVIAVSEKDGAYFKDLNSDIDVRVIPTGVDLDCFRYSPPNGSKEIVFAGSMDSLSNIEGVTWFLQEVWGAIKAKHPDATVKIIGRYPPASLVNQFAVTDHVRFTGWVNDIYRESRTGGIYVVPLRVGSGTRIKVFEAMAMGIPVVSTAIGVEGLPVAHEQHYLKADTADSFAEAIMRLFADFQLRLRLSQNARRLVEEKFGWEYVAAVFAECCRFSQIFQEE
jgi:glycosyltransferase involved in cell wall biosynthesis